MTTPSQRFVNGFFVVVAILLILMLFAIPYCGRPKTKELEKILPASVLEKTVVQYVYIPPDINDSADAVITVNKDTVSYWYVYYEADVKSSATPWEFTGYKVIKLKTPYFDVAKSIFDIYPKYETKDFIGIRFFKRVPYETYKSYKETDGE